MATFKDGTTIDTTGQHNKKQDEKVLELIDAGYVPDELEMAQLYDPRSQYKPTEKVRACAYYMVYGNSKEVERKTGLPSSTVRKWKHSAHWWLPVMAWLRKQRQDELDSMITNVIHDGVDALGDRITNGDWILDKNNELIRIPIKGKEIAYISSVMFDKRALIRGDVTSITGKTINNLETIKAELTKHIRQTKEKDVVVTHPPTIQDKDDV